MLNSTWFSPMSNIQQQNYNVCVTIWLQCVELILYPWYLKMQNLHHKTFFKNNTFKNISFTCCTSFPTKKSMGHTLSLLGYSKKMVQSSILFPYHVSMVNQILMRSSSFTTETCVGVLLVSYKIPGSIWKNISLGTNRKKSEFLDSTWAVKIPMHSAQNCTAIFIVSK